MRSHHGVPHHYTNTRSNGTVPQLSASLQYDAFQCQWTTSRNGCTPSKALTVNHIPLYHKTMPKRNYGIHYCSIMCSADTSDYVIQPCLFSTLKWNTINHHFAEQQNATSPSISGAIKCIAAQCHYIAQRYLGWSTPFQNARPVHSTIPEPSRGVRSAAIPQR